MINFNIEIANTVFGISCRQEMLKKIYADYLTDKKAEVFVCATDEELAKTRKNYEDTLRNQGDFHTVSDARVEFLEHHRQVAEELLKRGVLLVHGSVVVADGMAYLFIAPSRTGKSTHTQLWLKLPDIDAFIINDDKPLLRPTENGVIVYSTPWGLWRKPDQGEAPLKAIAVLERGEKNTIAQISSSEIFPQMYKASLRGETREETLLVTDLEDKILSSVGLFRLKCNTDIEAAQIAYNIMSK